MATYRLHKDQTMGGRKPTNLLEKISKHWFQILVILFFLHIIFNKDVNIQVNLSDKTKQESIENGEISKVPASLNASNLLSTNGKAQNMVLKNKETTARTKINHNYKSSDFRTLSFVLNPDLAERKGVPSKIVDEKIEKCRKYVERFAAVAISEKEKFGIPASITLAQGLLESDAGESKLSRESNNHFGIKCKTKCEGCTCRNYADDDKYDMFRVFETVWSSYREHSKLLGGKRYKHLKELGLKDYKNWAHGLKKAGYATDKRYAEKLIKIIEQLDLYQFD